MKSKPERAVQILEDRVVRLRELGRPIPHALAEKFRAARLHALQVGPVRRPLDREAAQ